MAFDYIGLWFYSNWIQIHIAQKRYILYSLIHILKWILLRTYFVLLWSINANICNSQEGFFFKSQLCIFLQIYRKPEQFHCGSTSPSPGCYKRSQSKLTFYLLIVDLGGTSFPTQRGLFPKGSRTAYILSPLIINKA